VGFSGGPTIRTISQQFAWNSRQSARVDFDENYQKKQLRPTSDVMSQNRSTIQLPQAPWVKLSTSTRPSLDVERFRLYMSWCPGGGANENDCQPTNWILSGYGLGPTWTLLVCLGGTQNSKKILWEVPQIPKQSFGLLSVQKDSLRGAQTKPRGSFGMYPKWIVFAIFTKGFFGRSLKLQMGSARSTQNGFPKWFVLQSFQNNSLGGLMLNNAKTLYHILYQLYFTL